MLQYNLDPLYYMFGSNGMPDLNAAHFCKKLLIKHVHETTYAMPHNLVQQLLSQLANKLICILPGFDVPYL